MGVKGLTKFITVFEKRVVDRIDIREEIANWKIDHDGKPPTIIIDLKELAHMFVQKDQMGVVLGGHYDRYNKMLRQLLDNFTKAGAKLVFFMPGRKYTDELQFFIPKTEQDYMESLELLDKIEECVDLKTYLHEKNRRWSDIRMELSYNYNLRKLVNNFGEFNVNYDRHNQEIARYANQNADTVLAVISNDTDFLAFSGDFEFWRANSVNYKEMTCNRYNRQKLYDRLEFQHGAVQLQLLSALSGSNFLPSFAIQDFLGGLASENDNPEKRGKIWNVAEYVKRQPITKVKNKITFNLQKIGHDVFGDEFTRDQLNCIENGLDCYKLEDFQQPERNLSSFLRFCKTRDHFAFKLATDPIFNVKDITYMDFRNYKAKSYAELVIPLLMKMCGILFKDNARRPAYREICMKHAHDEPCKVTEEVVNYPPMKLPELFDIIFKNKEREFDKCRWALLEWAVDLDEGIVKKIRGIKGNQSNQMNQNNHRFAAVIVTLLYLVQQEELTAKEANVILYTEHQIRNLSNNKSEYPEQTNVRYVRIAHLYVKMYVLISHCFDVCGVHDMTDLIRFDGAIFHRYMEKFETAGEQCTKVLESAIQPIWIFTE